MTNYLDKNSKIKSSLKLKDYEILNSDDIDKIKPLIVDTQTINEYYFEKESINDKTYTLKEEYRDLSYSFNRRKKEGFEGEYFIDYPQDNKDLNIQVSNFGRIRINGEIAEQTEEYKNYNREYKNIGHLQLEYPSKNENINKAWKAIKNEDKYIYNGCKSMAWTSGW
jgi:hypothetical protein